MKLTLLQLTQDILYSMDGDEITSITDNYESTQVAHLIRTVYYDIVARSGLPEQNVPFQLISANDTTQPLVMTLPTSIRQVYWIKYDYTNASDTDKQYTPVVFQDWDTFLKMSHQLNQSDTTVDLMTLSTSFGGIDILYRNDLAPSYYTTYDDRTVVFNSIDVSTDTSLYLAASKTQAYGVQAPTFTLSDAYTPDLDDDQFPLLLAEAKSLAWAEMKQAQNSKAEQSAKRNWVIQGKNKNAISTLTALDKLPNYGRK